VGRILLVCRLAVRDLRRRPAEGVLLLLAIAAATTVLTLGLALRHVISTPYESTREATAGPDVVVTMSAADRRPDRVTDVSGLLRDRSVVAHSGPYRVMPTVLEANGRSVVAAAEGRDTATAAVDQPKTTRGGWVRDGGIVLEAAFAQALHVGPGDRVTLKPMTIEDRGGNPLIRGHGNGRSFRVAGVAVSAAAPPYGELACAGNLCLGEEEMGYAWLTRADVARLQPQTQPSAWILNLRLADPATAPAFAARHNPAENFSCNAGDPCASEAPPAFLQSWQDIRDDGANLVKNQRRALLTGAWLLALLAIASVAVLVGGRMADQIRRVGLLKAVGGTPGLVAAVLLAEYVAVALLAAVAGLAIG